LADRRVKLTYTQALVDQPILHRLIAKFGLLTNIRRAEVTDAGGWLVVDLRGEETTINQAIEWLQEVGIEVEEPA
jgi:ABC-type methionine transport system ATPase subunit